MNPLVLILCELRHRRLHAVMSVVGLAVAVALMVVVRTLTSAAERETRRVVRDLGFNLRIIPRDTDIDRFYDTGYPDGTLPEDAARRLAEGAGTFVSFNHLTPTLERRFPIAGRDVLLTGLGPAVVGPGEKKQPMGFTVPAGRVYLGHAVAERLGLKAGGKLELGGRAFGVEKVLAEAGTQEDIRVYTALGDAQSLLGLAGRISEIRAIDCLCLTADQDPLSQLRVALAKILPEGRVVQMRTMADARAKQRQAAERFAAFAVPMVLLVGAIWTGVLAFLNVRERRAEIGLWRALGSGSGRVALLFLGRAVVLGLIAAGVGHAMGTAAALHYGPRLYPVTAGGFAMDISLLWRALMWTPVYAAVASFLPAMMAVAHDPAETLRTD